ncbi:MAG: alpha/beta hydrolase [Bacteroidota bacterium]
MKKHILTTLIGLLISFYSFSQSTLADVEQQVFQTDKNMEIEGEVGYLQVPENRKNPSSRKVKVKYVRLKSLAANPGKPIVYLEGGGGSVTWQAEDPDALTDWLDYLEIADLIFIDRRGTNDESLIYVWQNEFPENFFVTEEAANLHYKKMVEASLKTFDERGIDVTGYTIEEHAKDVDDLMTALGAESYSMVGFSFGSHIGMTVMKLFPDRIEKAVMIGSDAPNQSLNYPRYLHEHIRKIAEMVKADNALSQTVPDFEALVNRVMKKLAQNPVTVTIKNPLTGADMELKIGAFGLALILRLDIDDYNDIPIIPRLLYTIEQGDYSMLTWFAQKRVVFSLAVPGNGINQQLASGASTSRWAQIEKEAGESIFGNVVNFPFSAAKPHWVSNPLSFDPSAPLRSDIPTLFITGDMDCRTPVAQVEETKKGFSNAKHIIVKNAGHEQAMWDDEVANEMIPNFLKDGKVKKTDAYYGDIEFIKVSGKAEGHPSIE